MKSIQKAVFIEWRRPNGKKERKYYGLTEYENEHVAKVFISTNGRKHLVDTFFHEMAHVFFAFHQKNKKMSNKREESLASHIGKACAAILQ